MNILKKTLSLGIVGCVLLAGIFGFVSILYELSKYAVIFDFLTWVTLFFVLAATTIKLKKTEKQQPLPTIILLVVVGAVIATWAPWSMDILWRSRGVLPFDNLWIISGMCTFSMYVFTVLAFLVVLHGVDSARVRKPLSEGIFFLGILAFTAIVSTLFEWMLVFILGDERSVTLFAVWLRELIIYASFFLSCFFFYKKHFLIPEKKRLSIDCFPKRKNRLLAILVLTFSLLVPFLPTLSEFIVPNDDIQRILILVVWLIFFLVCLVDQESKRKNETPRLRSSIIVGAVACAVFTFYRGGIGFMELGLEEVLVVHLH